MANKRLLISNHFWILGLVLLTVCTKEKPASGPPPRTVTSTIPPLAESVKFFTGWFESHGHSDVVVDEQGVGVSNNATRLKASLYESKKPENGQFVVETEFRIKLPSGPEIIEFVAGMGDTEEKAINDTLANFTLTTFHVIYKAFINDDDPHMTSAQLQINGRSREVVTGDLYTRRDSSGGELILDSMPAKIEATLSDLQLNKGPHWIKLVYSQLKGEPMTVSASIDNLENERLTKAISALEWPRSDSFYMVKQFIVIKPELP